MLNKESIGKPLCEVTSISGLLIMSGQVLEIEEGEKWENTQEPRGGLKIVLGIKKEYAVKARIFRSWRSPRGIKRYPFGDRKLNETFGITPGREYYIEVEPDAVVMDGRQYVWQW